VGDDAQSIYSFRTATVRNILDFLDQFSPKAEIVALRTRKETATYRAREPDSFRSRFCLCSNG
jgi:DNA helicase II / ATP-dependent DNA helicase PcrA